MQRNRFEMLVNFRDVTTDSHSIENVRVHFIYRTFKQPVFSDMKGWFLI